MIDFIEKEPSVDESFQSYIFEDEHPGVPKHLHSINKIAARKNTR